MERSKEIYTIVITFREEEEAQLFEVTGWQSHAELGFLELQLAHGLRVLFINFDDIVSWEVPFVNLVENHEN